MRIPIVLTLLVAMWVQAQESAPKPITLAAGELSVTVELPDGKSGWYRGTRFDWSGMTSKVKFGEHELANRWQTGTRNPQANDDIWGFAEEFDNGGPMGYDQCKPGDTFVKIGVGKLKRTSADPYHFYAPYPIVEPGTWTTKQLDQAISFTQSMEHVPSDPAGVTIKYQYVKTLSVNHVPASASQPANHQLIIKHELTNRADRPLTFTHYNHHFLLVDGDGVGPNYELKLNFPISAPQPRERFSELALLTGNRLNFRGPLDKGSVFCELTGHTKSIPDYGFELRHQPSKLLIKCAGDQPLFKFNFWCVEKTLCPEPYTKLTAQPGSTVTWSLAYSLRKE